jgi:hypothetical protein
MNDGTVNGVYAALRVVSSAPGQGSRIIGGAIAASNGYGVEIEQFSDVFITGCAITGTETDGGVYVESGLFGIYLDYPPLPRHPVSMNDGRRRFLMGARRNIPGLG